LSAINEQLTSNNIVNVVSAEKMKELPDANLAESIGRLPGVSIQRDAGEASKIVVRGLSPKFNRVTVEGVPMVSTSNSDRSIDLSLIGDDLIEERGAFKIAQAGFGCGCHRRLGQPHAAAGPGRFPF
jgi:outer membrane receptor for ferrienterochelin and colicin